jgi:hypothetical protein
LSVVACLAIFSTIISILRSQKERIKTTNEKSIKPEYYRVSAKIGKLVVCNLSRQRKSRL